jgi:tetratricopeptide (TPR) repeat protein
MTDYYRRSLSVFSQLDGDNSGNPAVRDELARAYETLGDGLSRTDARAERLDSYKKALEIRQQLLAGKPDDRKLRRSIATSFYKVGAADPTAPDAIANVRKAIEILEALSAADPNSARARREVGFVYYQLGQVEMERRDFAGALETRRKAFAIRKQIAEQDPTNMQAKFDLAVDHANLSETLTAVGQTDEALREAEAALPLLEQLCASDPTNAVYQRNLALCYQKFAEADARGASAAADRDGQLNHWHEAHNWYDKAAKLFADLRASGRLMPSDAAQPEAFASKAADCDRRIADLTQSTSAP